MQFLIRSILEHALLEGAKIVAGAQGMNNRVLWVNLMEILDSPDSLQKGELLVTTGYRLDDEARHKGLVAHLRVRGLSGIAIQPGYYIERIPDYILRDADACGLPVIELPKNLTFSHIMHVLIENITLRPDFYADPELASLRARLAQWEQEAAGGPVGGMWEQACDGDVHLLLVTPGTGAEAQAKGLERLRACLLAKCAALRMETAGDKALFLLALRQDAALHDALFDVSLLVPSLAKVERLNLLIGAGTAPKASDLTQALDETAECCEMLRKAGALRGVCPYASISLFDLLENVQKNNGRALLLAHDALRDLSEHDRAHGTAYMQTLRVYLAYQASAEVSGRLFIHRHTLTNRMDRIAAICRVDLRDPVARLHLSLALLISDCYTP